MIIYNVTVHVEESIHDAWLSWIKDHIPMVLSTGRFSEAKLTKVLVEEESGDTSYSIQYRAKTREDLDNYYKFDAEKLKSEGLKKFSNKILTFRTELEIIDEFSVTKN